jgi:hypothetical protein
MNTPKRETIEAKAARLGLSCGTWSPGDGATRYRFFAGVGHGDYHEGHELGTCLGRAEAHTWLNGYAAARMAAAEKGETR